MEKKITTPLAARKKEGGKGAFCGVPGPKAQTEKKCPLANKKEGGEGKRVCSAGGMQGGGTATTTPLKKKRGFFPEGGESRAWSFVRKKKRGEGTSARRG